MIRNPFSFLDDLERIATKHYEPSDDDILRARLRTLGIQEYKIDFDQSTSLISSAFNVAFNVAVNISKPSTDVGLSGNFGQEWKLYDVGGARTVVCRLPLLVMSISPISLGT